MRRDECDGESMGCQQADLSMAFETACEVLVRVVIGVAVVLSAVLIRGGAYLIGGFCY